LDQASDIRLTWFPTGCLVLRARRARLLTARGPPFKVELARREDGQAIADLLLHDAERTP
jgi:hypothetical protein